jgi:hypothetical protein
MLINWWGPKEGSKPMTRSPKEWRELISQAGDSVSQLSEMLDDWERQSPQTEENAIFSVDGKEYCDETLALAALLLADHILVFKNEDKTLSLHVNCSDLFAWACADSEPLLFDDLPILYKLRNEKWGISKWCCKKRNEKPQKPIEDEMKLEGVWDEEMEALPENTMDSEVKASFYSAAKQQGLVQ